MSSGIKDNPSVAHIGLRLEGGRLAPNTGSTHRRPCLSSFLQRLQGTGAWPLSRFLWKAQAKHTSNMILTFWTYLLPDSPRVLGHSASAGFGQLTLHIMPLCALSPRCRVTFTMLSLTITSQKSAAQPRTPASLPHPSAGSTLPGPRLSLHGASAVPRCL